MARGGVVARNRRPARRRLVVGRGRAAGPGSSAEGRLCSRQRRPDAPAWVLRHLFADGVGHARHLVVAPSGVVYVNTWSGRYYGNDTPPAGGFLGALAEPPGH